MPLIFIGMCIINRFGRCSGCISSSDHADLDFSDFKGDTGEFDTSTGMHDSQRLFGRVKWH
ncbi:hypothetical protein BQ8482_120028 [Mesorhizobium delmotii]|uniref:Uncharacterized protein n=1 Tax=Mesorhizobium delmotii TaxID=1631247 RepID=A0A2P9AFR6_9HYPH|nr:hypothetical protein BQ8482_120028 [Mesorhizobium delmotii]